MLNIDPKLSAKLARQGARELHLSFPDEYPPPEPLHLRIITTGQEIWIPVDKLEAMLAKIRETDEDYCYYPKAKIIPIS